MAPSPRGLIGFVTLAIPAAIGVLLLFFTIPMIGSLLSIERSLFVEPFDEIVIHAGCEDVAVWVTVEAGEYVVAPRWSGASTASSLT